jgi:peroxiredoxin
VATLGPRDFFGEVALLLRGRRNASVRAVDEVQLWVLSGQDFNDLLAHYMALDTRLIDSVRARLPARQVLLTPSQHANGGPTERDLAPDVTLQSLTGQTWSIAEFRGTNVVLWLSRGLADPGCVEFAVHLNSVAPQFEAAHIQLIQVVPDSVAATQAAWGSKGFKHLVLCDPEKSAYVQFGLCETVPSLSAGVSGDTVVIARGVEPQILPLSWQHELDVQSGNDRLGSNIAVVLEGLIVIDRGGAIRAKRLTAASGPLPEPEELLQRLSRALG